MRDQWPTGSFPTGFQTKVDNQSTLFFSLARDINPLYAPGRTVTLGVKMDF